MAVFASFAAAQSNCALSDTTTSAQLVGDVFYAKRPGSPGTLRYRDLEFHWDAQYDSSVNVLLSTNDLATLDQLGRTIAHEPQNPLGIDATDLHLVYEYFRRGRPAYDINPAHQGDGPVVGDSIGLVVCKPNPCTSALPNQDRRHVDIYLVKPGHGLDNYGHYRLALQRPKKIHPRTSGFRTAYIQSGTLIPSGAAARSTPILHSAPMSPGQNGCP